MAVPNSAYDTTRQHRRKSEQTSATVRNAACHNPDEETHAHTAWIPVDEGHHAKYARADLSAYDEGCALPVCEFFGQSGLIWVSYCL